MRQAVAIIVYLGSGNLGTSQQGCWRSPNPRFAVSVLLHGRSVSQATDTKRMNSADGRVMQRLHEHLREEPAVPPFSFAMRELFSSMIFSELLACEQHGERIKQADMVHISAPASLEGVLALGQLEAACLDVGLKYRRRLFTSRHHLPRDAPPAWSTEESGLSVIVDAEEATWEVGELQKQPHVHLVPLTTSVVGEHNRKLRGALDTVVQAAALAAYLAQTADGSVDYVRTFRWGSGWVGPWDEHGPDPHHDVNHLRRGERSYCAAPEVESFQGILLVFRTAPTRLSSLVNHGC